jgi:hypothetical protein
MAKQRISRCYQVRKYLLALLFSRWRFLTAIFVSGEMILYESHSVIHGRPFPLEGDFYANIFAHFEPLGPLDQNGESNNDISGEMPPYLIPNTSWEEQWKQQNPDGWKAVSYYYIASIFSSGASPCIAHRVFLYRK